MDITRLIALIIVTIMIFNRVRIKYFFRMILLMHNIGYSIKIYDENI